VPLPDCPKDTLARHGDPVALVREFVARDAAGRALTPGDWHFGALLCLETATSDQIAIITAYTVTPLTTADDSAQVLVQYARHSIVGWDASGTQMHLAPALGEVVDTVVLLRTRLGWRIARIDGGAHLLPKTALDSLGPRLTVPDRDTLAHLIAGGGA